MGAQLSANFRIRNWRRFQHYKDRNPPWIKLHVETLSSEDWVTVDDASKLLAVVCMIIAAKNDGLVPNNPKYVRRVAYLNTDPDFGPLISCGFLEITQADASTMLATARPEEETYKTEEERRDMSDFQSDPSDSAPRRTQGKKAVRTAYPSDFEEFWKAYPTDRNMSKLMASKEWAKLSEDDRRAAIAAVPAFKAYCSKDKTYRPLHAVRFLSQRRFEGFAPAPSLDPETVAANQDRADRLLRRGKYAEIAA